MKKIVGIIAWLLALSGVCMIVLTSTVIDNYIVFFIGVGALVMGIIGSLFAGKETKETILRLLDLI